MNRKARYVVKWWLLGILIFTSLMPGPVGAHTVQDTPVGQTTTFLPLMQKPSVPAEVAWPMAGANSQRTSWTPEQVPSAEYLSAHRNEFGNGMLYPQWYRPIEPYISSKVQIIAANGTLFIATAKGLYALDADTGDVKWVYPTEMPLGHSPTYHETVLFKTDRPKRLYIPGFDHKIHAIDADPNLSSLPIDPTTGQRINNQLIWTFEAEQGFSTNPLAVELKNPADGKTHLYVYAGNRDSYEYAIEDMGSSASLFWKYKTGGPVLFSTAISSNNQSVFFASNDSYVYALNATTGSLVWRSEKQPGAGFHSWWPVVHKSSQDHREYVLVAGSHNYRDNVPPGTAGTLKNLEHLDRELFLGANNYGDSGGSCGATIGQRMANNLIDTSVRDSKSAMSAQQYYKNKPWRRTYFVLDGSTGKDADFNSDNQPDYAPFLWLGSQGGNRFPSIINPVRDVIYQLGAQLYRHYINGGGILGWRFGTPFVSTPQAYMHVVDEPVYAAGGGNIVYWSAGNTAAGAFDTSVENTVFFDRATSYNGGCTPQTYASPGNTQTREWTYWDYNLDQLAPGFDEAAGGPDFGGRNGTYGWGSGDGNPPIPYRNKIYLHKGNAILAFGTTRKPQGAKLPLARTIAVKDFHPSLTSEKLKEKLASEVQKIVTAGHLRPGFLSSGLVDGKAKSSCGDNFQDYYSNPADLLYALIRALPHLPQDMAATVKTYLQSEFNAYPPYRITHVGWQSGSSRDFFDLPPEVDADRGNYGPTEWLSYGFEGWGQQYGGTNIPPHVFYVLWKYAQALGYTQAQAQDLLDQSNGRLDTTPPNNDVFVRHPFVLNSFINGYQGYLELQKMAGITQSANISDRLADLRSLRASTFTKDTYYNYGTPNADMSCRAFSASANFIYLTPELGEYLRTNALSKVQAALNEYYHNTPYWFVERFESTVGEGVFAPLYDVNLLLAKALILKEPREELVKYLDAPAFPVGDIFYIQNLVASIEADYTLTTTDVASESADALGPSKAKNANVPSTDSDLSVSEICQNSHPDR